MPHQIEQMEVSLEHAKELVERKRQAEKLGSNREFKKLILDGYCQQEAARLVSLSGDPQMKEHRDEIFADIEAIGRFQAFLRTTIQIGRQAEAEIADYEFEIDALRNEEFEGSEDD